MEKKKSPDFKPKAKGRAAESRGNEWEKTKELLRKQGKLLAELWANPALKQRFINDPIPVLRERGFSIPEGVKKVIVTEDIADTIYLSIPFRKTEIAERLIDDEVFCTLGVPTKPFFTS